MRPFRKHLLSTLMGFTVPVLSAGMGCSSSSSSLGPAKGKDSGVDVGADVATKVPGKDAGTTDGSKHGDGGTDATMMNVAPTVAGIVVDTTGVPLPGVAVTVGAVSTMTGSDGKFALTATISMTAVASFRKTGYAGRTLSYDLTAGSQLSLYISLLAETAPQSLDATAGGTVTGPRGSSITIPPMSLVDATGALVTGSVQVSLTPIDPSIPAEREAYPAGLQAENKAGQDGYLSTYGVLDIEVTQNGKTLNLKPGSMAAATVPAPSKVAAPPATVASWSLDETTGVWNEEGTAALDTAAHVYAIALPHLSDWNCDVFNLPGCIYGQLVDEQQHPMPNAVIEAFVADNLSGGLTNTDQNGYFCLVMAVDESGTTLHIFPHAQINAALYYSKSLGGLPNMMVSQSVFMCNDPTMCAQLMKLTVNTSVPPGSDGGSFDSGMSPGDGGGTGPGAGPACTLGTDAGTASGSDGGAPPQVPLTGCLAPLNSVFECFSPGGGSCSITPTSMTNFTTKWANGSKIAWTTTGSLTTGILSGPSGMTCGQIVSGSGGAAGATISDELGNAWLFSGGEAGADGGQVVTCEPPGGPNTMVTLSARDANTVSACSGSFGLGGGSGCTVQNPVGAPCPHGVTDCTTSAPDCCMGKAGPLCLPASACTAYASQGCGKTSDCTTGGDVCCAFPSSPFPLCLPALACTELEGGAPPPPPPTDSGAPVPCKVSLTGAVTETFSCTATASYFGLVGTTIQITSSSPGFADTTSFILPNPPGALTTYTTADSHVATTSISQTFDAGMDATVTKAWAQQFQAASTDGGMVTDIGDFSLFLSSVTQGATVAGDTSYTVHGTATAVVPTSPTPDAGPFVNVTITF